MKSVNAKEQAAQKKEFHNKLSESTDVIKNGMSEKQVIKRKYEVKTAEFKKTMQGSTELIEKQTLDHKNFQQRYSELGIELDNSKSST